MKLKWLETLGVLSLILVVLLVLLILLGGAYLRWAFTTSYPPEEIKAGFSPELLETLQTQYGITIPEQAQFIKGYNLPNWRDSYVAILFAYPTEQPIEDDIQRISDSVRQLLKLDSTRYPGFGNDIKAFSGSDWYDELGGVMDHATRDNKSTTISCTVQPDKILIRVIGWRPGANFR